MGAPKIFNLALKVNDKEATTTLNSVGKELKALRGYTRNLEEGTEQWQKANKKLAETEKVYDGMKKKQRDFINQTKEASDATGDNKKAIQDFGQSFGQVTAGIMSGDLTQVQAGLVGMKNGIFAATKASLAFIATPLGAVLAGLALAIGAVTAYFRDSEEGQNSWNKITAVTSAVVGTFTDLLSDLGEMLFKVFSDPVQSLKDFGNLVKDNIINRFEGMLELIPGLASAVKLFFAGDFEAAGKVAADAVGKVTLGVESVTDAVDKTIEKGKEWGNKLVDNAAKAKELADMAAKADLIERDLIVEKGKVEAKVAENRRKAREDDKLSAIERNDLMNEASKLQADLKDKEIEAAEIRFNIKKEENKLSKSDKVAKDEEAQLEAKVYELKRKKEDEERTLLRDKLRITNEIKKAAAGSGKADPAIAEEKKRLEAIDKLEADYVKKAEDREADSALKKAELEQQRAIEKAKSLGANQALIDQIEAEHQIKVDEAKTEEEEKELERMKSFEAKKRELENELELAKAVTEEEKAAIKKEQELEKETLLYEEKLAKFEEEMAFLQLTEEEKNSVIESLKEAHENAVLGIQKKATDEKIKDANRLNAEKKRLISDSLNAAITAAGAESKIGQALLIAKQLLAVKETAIQLGLFANKMALNAGEATGAAATGAAETAKVGFPQNIPLLIGFGIQIAGIISAVKNAAKAKSGVKTSFARGGFTDLFGMGYKDSTGHEVAGDVHVNEYVVPEVVRKDPEVPPILNYLERKRKKKLGLFAEGGDTGGDLKASDVLPTSGRSDSRQIALLEAILEALDITGDIFFGFEAEQKRQEAEDKLNKIKERAKIKKK